MQLEQGHSDEIAIAMTRHSTTNPQSGHRLAVRWKSVSWNAKILEAEGISSEPSSRGPRMSGRNIRWVSMDRRAIQPSNGSDNLYPRRFEVPSDPLVLPEGDHRTWI
jgi:hypothetical protein